MSQPARAQTDENLFGGSCVAFGDHLKTKGVYYDRYGGENASYHPKSAGYTLVWPEGSANVKASQTTLRERTWEEVTAICDCPFKPFRFYVGRQQVTQCATECQSGGLACATWECKVPAGKTCISAIVKVTVEPPPLTTTELIWQPPAASPRACKRLAGQFNADTTRHENQHKLDALAAVASANRKYSGKEVFGCGPTAADARYSLKEKIEALVESAKQEVFNNEQTKVKEFHNREPHELVLDCRKCLE